MTEVDHRSAVAAARRVHDALVAGQLDRIPAVPSPVRPLLAPDVERVLAVGTFELATFGPDMEGIAAGTTERPPIMARDESQDGLTMSDLRSVIRAVRSRDSRDGGGWGAAVAEAFGARWRTTHQGGLTVTTHGMYLDHGSVVHPWAWGLLTQVRLAGPGSLQYIARGSDGTRPWRLGSVWAELVLVLWAWHLRRDHPQLTSTMWAPLAEPHDDGAPAVDAGAPAAEGAWLPTPEADATPSAVESPDATPSEATDVRARGVDERIRDLLGPPARPGVAQRVQEGDQGAGRRGRRGARR